MPFTRDDDLRLSVRIGLTKGLRLVRAMRGQLDEEHFVLGTGGAARALRFNAEAVMTMMVDHIDE
jgi:hypothetical protein